MTEDTPGPTDHILKDARWPRDRRGLGSEDVDWFPTRTVFVRPEAEGGEPYVAYRQHADDPAGWFRVWAKFESYEFWWATRFHGSGEGWRRRQVVAIGQYTEDWVWEEDHSLTYRGWSTATYRGWICGEPYSS